CGNVCGAAQACVSGGCIDSCPSGLTECARSCVDTRTDSAHCGVCNMACDPGEGCRSGACVPSIPLGPPPARCEGGGPPIVIHTDGADLCADRTAAVSFTYGLCSCDAIGLPRLSSETEIDAFDSRTGPYVAGAPGGGMAANGSASTTRLTVSGQVRVAGADGLDVTLTSIGEDLHVRHDVSGGEAILVGADAYIGGDVMTSNLSITGRLHTPDCAAVPGGVTSASCVSQAVTVPDPCACAASDRVPVGAIVDYYAVASHNDNATVSLDPSVLATAGGGGARRLDLPCGYYYLDAIAGAATIAAHGRTALFVGGDVDASAAMDFVVDPGATLDVFVAGTLHTTASLRVGSPAYPHNVRFYIGGADASFDPPRSVYLESDVDLAGLFYAANGAVVSSSTLEMYGAVFAGSFHNSSATRIHYDAASASLGEDCPDVPTGCTSCRDCGNQACIDGACGACRSNADCCSPLTCVDGTCTVVLF
ncbi:MAG: hypothetical protein IT378_24555, partial [Sandaracinaceae bacterium]|nr:hypothetical protein [Sandaracinaceae bacterium]